MSPDPKEPAAPDPKEPAQPAGSQPSATGAAATTVVSQQIAAEATAASPESDNVEPLDSAQLMRDLIDDGRRVAAYGQRTGRLTDGNLIYALAAIEAKADGVFAWNDPAIITLQTALNRGIAAIYPTTLADLHDKEWQPFRRRPAITRGNVSFVLFALFLMAITAYWTVQYNKGAEITLGIEQLNKEEPRAAIGAIVRQLLRAKAEAPDATPVLPDEPYFTLIDQLHSYDARFEFYAPQMQTFLRDNELLHDKVLGTWTAVSNFLASVPRVGSATAAATGGQQSAQLPQYQVCAPQDGSSGMHAYVPASNVGKVLTEYVSTSIDVLCVEGIRFMPFLLPQYDIFLQSMRQWSIALGLWYLPALYGILGATLFYLRRVLDPTVPNPPFIHILHRLALGAFAGVIVTWFWAPNRELAEGFTTMGLTLFTLAFLIGFCVDVLFALLDRLVTVLMDIAKGGPPPSNPITVPAVVLTAAPNQTAPVTEEPRTGPTPAPAAATS